MLSMIYAQKWKPNWESGGIKNPFVFKALVTKISHDSLVPHDSEKVTSALWTVVKNVLEALWLNANPM